MAITVTFYNCADDYRVVDKTLGTAIATASAELYDETSVRNPSLKLAWNSSVVNANYMYISEWGRYYFIKDITAVTGGAMRIDAHVDVRKTYGAQFKLLPGVCVRQSRTNQSGSYRATWIPDPKLPLTTGRSVRAVEFQGTALNIDTATSTSVNFILNVAGGGAVNP